MPKSYLCHQAEPQTVQWDFTFNYSGLVAKIIYIVISTIKDVFSSEYVINLN